ncbi:conserved hypothetical protein [Pseudomonas veronii]|uniref:hypothetical protein n=1 Tax=Pseudomonas veronii TaxID=76761 RepID=UPI00176EE81E|nr:hypothetical protein [Pseudomonas veronii]CAD0264198.1 conserved hypothetical protein [Pseudomonas veronii]
MKVETIVQLNPEDCGLQHSIVRLHNSNIDSKRLDRKRFFRREALVICNSQNGARVLRYAMGTPGGISITKRAVALDYDAVDVLGVIFKTAVELEIRRASTFEVYKWFWNHPDLSVRLSPRLGVTGGILGVMGFFVGLAPYLPLLGW